MKPTLAQLIANCPDIDPTLANEHLQRLPDRYFETFSVEEVRQHLQGLSQLAPPNASLETVIATNASGRVNVTVLAFDHPSVFSLITGVLAGSRLSVESGAVFTYDPPPPYENHGPRSSSRRRQASQAALYRRRRIIDHFSGHLPEGVDPRQWANDFKQRLGDILTLLEQRSQAALAEARSNTNEMVAGMLEDLGAETRSRSALLPVRLEVNNSGRFTRLSVNAQDTPAFLYALSNALSLCRVSIEQVRIETRGQVIQDDVDIVDRHGRKINDERALNQIKLSVLLTKQFTYFLTSAPDPYAALSRFEKLVNDVLQLPEQGQWVEMLSSPRVLQNLARLLGASDFLWEDFVRLQYESLIPMLAPHVETQGFSHAPEELQQLLRNGLHTQDSYPARKQFLNEFKDNEIFRIDLEHILNPELDFKQFSEQLTQLAEVVVGTAANVVRDALIERYGAPCTVGSLPAPYAIFGLGKMGGAALGYASDIELLLVYSDNGYTDGRERITNAEFYNRLVYDLNQFITAKRDGIFNLDLRLRPHGNDGPLAVSLESFCEYYGTQGSAHSYERLALVRLRCIGGDRELGQRVERLRNELVYFTKSINPAELQDLRRKQFAEKIRPGQVNAKFSPGALVDLEYDVQMLQVMFGHSHNILRTPRVHEALSGLARTGVITDAESTRLLTAYDFLRQLINGLRMLRGSARDLFLPDIDSVEFDHLARRMGYRRTHDLRPAQQLRLDFDTCTAAVRAFVERHFGRDALPGPVVGNVADLVLSQDVPLELRNQLLQDAGFQQPERAFANLKRLAGDEQLQMIFARLAVLACDALRRNPDPDMALNNWERFLSLQDNRKEHYDLLLSQPRRLDILLSVMAGSQFLADTLVRYPQFFDWATRPENIQHPRRIEDIRTELLECAHDTAAYNEWLNELRRYRRREILRIGTRDIYLRSATAEIMRDLSNVAEAITDCALDMVWKQLAASDPDAGSAAPSFCIMAFGKLGGNELNYSSDIDLIGVFDPPQDEKEITQKRCADAMALLRAALSSHTEEGYAYRVDLRLRAYGRAGELVTSIDSLTEYYRNTAALWEIQAALKMRPIAGNRHVGDKFLATMQPILRRARDTQAVAASIRTLRNATVRQGQRLRPDVIDVKNGQGGIRDIEFLVQGLQMIHAHAHVDLLTGNTLDGLGHLADLELLDPHEAVQLREAYLFLRQVEHCLQIFEDRQVHIVPTGQNELTALARRVLGPDTDATTFSRHLTNCLTLVHDLYERRLC